MLPEKHGGLGGSALFVMASKAVNEKRFSELKEAFLHQNSQIISEDVIQSKINMQPAQSIEDYHKIFLNLQNGAEP